MAVLILGLVIFLGAHSVRIFAEGWRDAQIARLGEKGWKGAYSIASIVGLVLIIWGYGIARRVPVPLWAPPVWAPHVTALLTLVAFILFPAAQMRGTRLKSVVKHPMVIGVALWALGHLLANGTMNAVVLFGAFLVWAVFDFAAARRRDRAAQVVYPAGTLSGDLKAIVAGVIAWIVFAFFLHGWLIGVKPLG
ncbi:NnrU family protein [Paraburkholderia rhizosphaerae]|uniref:Putative membrane protein n=1 Tax=Paraburkholderia rhizosphaerae TaxID=480658 RepID=A0A4R8LJN0_9BURK|nr:NnrU family protein [Paraburkholderia rhizosphaerae]TDY43226.1 putative membrane protein [Paraburkholderia rhizosphaerae]